MKSLRLFVSMMFIIASVVSFQAFANEPSGHFLTMENQDEQNIEKCEAELDKVGGCIGCKGCKSVKKMARCTVVVAAAVEVCADTGGAGCAAGVLAVTQSSCCGCLPGPLQTMCNKLK